VTCPFNKTPAGKIIVIAFATFGDAPAINAAELTEVGVVCCVAMIINQE
jgi:hypothetical protein